MKPMKMSGRFKYSNLIEVARKWWATFFSDLNPIELKTQDDTIEFKGKVSQADKMSKDQLSSFRAGSKTVLLKKGFVLHRLTGKHDPIGACWIDDETYRMFMNSLKQMETAVRSQQSVMRNDMGLVSEWKNTLSRRIKITLSKDTIAHVGKIGPQYSYVEVNSTKYAFNKSEPKAQKRIEWRRGGHDRYVIPSISSAKLDNSEKYGFKINVNSELF